MKRITLTIFGLYLTVFSFGQTNNTQRLIELGKAYKNFMFKNEPDKNFLKDLKTNVPENLKVATDFIVQTITTNNKLLTQTFLERPTNQVLKQIYIIREINLNLREENQIDNGYLIDSLTIQNIPVYELVNCYYGMLFTAIGNKNQPFDLSKVDFKMKNYNLADDTEKGIFFLRCMNLCGTLIWGYINIAKPVNTQKALEFIEKYPKFNGQPYYQYNDFYFTDFEMVIVKDKGLQSYKSYYLDKYYETLLNHLLCLNKENRTQKEKNDLLLGSILKEKNLYKYSKQKEILEGLFTEIEKN